METNEQKQFQCTGDCLKCIAVQRQYCASQHSHDSVMMLRELSEAVKALSSTVEDLKAKIEAIQDNEALVFDPKEDADNPSGKPKGTLIKKAQEGDGAEE